MVPSPFHRGKESLFNKFWEKWISRNQKMELSLYKTPYTNVTSKWIKGLHVRAKTVEPSEENTGKELHGIRFGKDFLDVTPKAETTKVKVNNLDYVKMQNSYTL